MGADDSIHKSSSEQPSLPTPGKRGNVTEAKGTNSGAGWRNRYGKGGGKRTRVLQSTKAGDWGKGQ